ncbi:rhomboid family intramembrane serine protease [Falsarthrobacter nasiphocae]|uniref:Membrane associated rhomboid family serine protease n=1 Tax=Falsarthrobacter nasiphocae TaxID=189863 RepID=A0AAE3YHE8_9MICC|nr:rhomboid family intramembrane serine protease [Falsarthrobacter nasiphocae]MDR6892061.1 membrane associated rhomboid family serine protease [Falsarthrobacter nasiphocae]
MRPALAYDWALKPGYVAQEPLTVVTNAFLHDPDSFAHIGTNLVSLWIFGRMLEPLIGAGRMAGLLTVSILSASTSVLLLEAPGTYTIGFSGAIFGLIGAVLAVQRSLRMPVGGTLVLLGVNALMPLLVSNISWQGHLGGFIGGLLWGLLVLGPRLKRERIA